MLNLKIFVIMTIGFILLSCCGCKKKHQLQIIPVTVQGDMATKAAVENILKSSLSVVIPKTGTEYSIQIVKPDPGIEYSILQVKPDPNTDYSIIIIDPTTQQPTSKIDPDVTQAIIEALRKQKQETEK